MRIRTLFWLLFSVITFVAHAQITPPNNGVLYTHTEIPKVHIIIDPDSLDALYVEENDNWYSDHEYPATFIFENQSGTDTLLNVGFRFRGNTSREKIKKSFKVSFNTFIPGRKYYGVEKLNLNAEANDPSLLRSRICWDLYRDGGLVASRSNHVEVYINGDYYGLYQNIEHIDEEFADTWFGSKKGNLYKCTYPANLQFISTNPDAYKLTPDGERTYELKTNEELDDYSGLAKFIQFLNQSNSSDFRCQFADYFDVYSYLKIAAIDVLTGNWDGYIYNQNNFYLYENPLIGKMNYIPYDTDNTWGIDWVGQNWATRNIYNWSQNDRPLYDRLMDEPKFRDIFSWHIRHLLETKFNTTIHRQAIENLQDFIAASALADPYRPLDYGFSDTDFLNALTQSAGDHVEYGIFNYADLREATAYNQLENNAIAPIISAVKVNFAEAPQILKVTAFADGPEVATAILAYDLNGVGAVPIPGIENGGSYVFEIPLVGNSAEVEYNISFTGDDGLVRNAFCESRNITLNPAQSGIVINEVVSSNQAGIIDEAGGHPDWIELYNAGASPINLSHFYLTDADASPLKWNLPDVTMNPGDFLLFYADGSIEQGPLHTNFNVNALGENLYLFRKNENDLTLIDKVAIPPMLPDYSYGREADGNLPWVHFSEPTPDASNNSTSIFEALSNSKLVVYPNPTTDIIYFSQRADFKLLNISGKLLLKGRNTFVNLKKFSNGSYILVLGDKSIVVQRF